MREEEIEEKEGAENILALREGCRIEMRDRGAIDKKTVDRCVNLC